MKKAQVPLLLFAVLILGACQGKQTLSSRSSSNGAVSGGSVALNIPDAPIGVIRINPTNETGNVSKPTFRVNFNSLPSAGYKIHLYRISCNPLYRIGTDTPNAFATHSLITSTFALPVTGTTVKFFANIEHNGQFSACSNAFALYRYISNTASESTSNDPTEVQIKEDGKMDAIDNTTSSLWDATWNLIMPSAYAAPKVYKKSQHKIYFQEQLKKGLSDQLGEEKFKDLENQWVDYVKLREKDKVAKLQQDLSQRIKLRFQKSKNSPMIQLTVSQIFENRAAVITYGKLAYYGLAILRANKNSIAMSLSDLKDGSVVAIGSTLVVLGGKDADGNLNPKMVAIYLDEETQRFKTATLRLLSTQVQDASYFKIVPVDADLAKKLKVPDDKIKDVVGKCIFRVVITTKNEIKEPRLLKIPDMVTSCPQVKADDLEKLSLTSYQDDVK